MMSVRRRVPLAELEPHGDVIAALADRRLLTISAGTVEVAHEALLREWPRLRGGSRPMPTVAGCTAT